MRTCKGCGIALPLTEFANAGIHNGKQYYRHVCKPCYHLGKASYKLKQRDKYTEYKKTLKCLHCGNDDHRVLHFHHHSDNKEYAVATMISTHSFDSVLQEIEKCDVLCANCHLIVHWNERNQIG